MKSRRLVHALLVTAVSCGGGALSPGAADSGTGDGLPATSETGGGPVAGAIGTSDAGGTTALPACTDSANRDSVEFHLLGADGALIATNMTTPVTVASLESCAPAGCAAGFIPAAGTRMGLTTADQQHWTLELHIPGMPSDLVKIGDTFNLTLAAESRFLTIPIVNQTLTLARVGRATVVAVSIRNFDSKPPVPNLEAFGIRITDEGPVCEYGGSVVVACNQRAHAARVTIGADSVLLTNGMTAPVGGFSFTSYRFVDSNNGACDSQAMTTMGGWRRIKETGVACTNDVECATGFCERPEGMCNATSGMCQDNAAGAACFTNPSECGCDGQTYASLCFRRRARVSKAHDGPC